MLEAGEHGLFVDQGKSGTAAVLWQVVMQGAVELEGSQVLNKSA